MRTVLCIILSSIALLVHPQTKSIKKSPLFTEDKAVNVGMSEERLFRIDNMLKLAIDSGEIPGVVALVARNGKIVYYKAFGKADNERATPMQRDNIFRIASQSKAIISTALMMLWEEGKFRLDDPVSKYIPEFGDAKIFVSLNETDSSFITKPATNQITIRNLLNHTSGIGYGIIDDDNFRKIYQKAGVIDLFTTSNISLKENISKLAKLPLHHEPGEKFTYGEGIDVVGYLVEVFSGMSLDKFLKERLFNPLGMSDTYFYLPDSKGDRLAPVQTFKDGKWVKYSNSYYDVDYPKKGAKTFFSGGAGLSSTAKDYATFLQMYLNNGELNGVRLLSRTTVQLILGNQTGTLFPDTNSHFGLAFQVINNNGEVFGGIGSEGTFSWGGYFNTQYFADPKEQVIGILMKQTQGVWSDNTAWKFKLLVEQSIDD